jgi:hypothetical protein
MHVLLVMEWVVGIVLVLAATGLLIGTLMIGKTHPLNREDEE